MVVKKVKNKPDSQKLKEWQIGDLVDYICHPHNINPKEKIEYAGSRDFSSSTHTGHKTEMIALAQESSRSKMPVQHWIFSWQEGEQPTSEQVEKVVDIFMKEMGLEGHQVIYGLHNNTENLHLHIAVNRVHPETEKAILPHNGFDIEVGHRIVAMVEYRQGWRSEENALYTALENGDLVKRKRSSQKQPGQKAKDFECATGEKSAQRIAQEKTSPIFKEAQSWQEVHELLAKEGMRFERVGTSGAVVFVGDIAVKASSVGRAYSFTAMSKKLGNFVPPTTPIQKKVFSDEAQVREAASRIIHEATSWRELHLSLEQRGLKYEKKGSGSLLLWGETRIKPSSLNRKCSLLNLCKRLGEYESFESTKRALPPEPVSTVNREDWIEYSKERADFTTKPQRVFKTASHAAKRKEDWNRLLQNQKNERKEILSGDWKGKNKELNALRKAISFQNRKSRNEFKQKQHTLGSVEQYTGKYFPRFETWLRQRGKNHKAEMWRYRRVFEDNKQESSFENQELSRSTQKEIPVNISLEADAFAAYHAAVGADAYRVTCIKMLETGDKKTFILDKHDGVTRGFTPEELPAHLPEMLRLQAKGENIYYTPLSEKQHHILIDDMTREKLEKFILDGFKPAVLLESSPGNYQCVLTIPKLGTAHDRDVGNRITERLNREYGDPKLSGCIHPHRAPGFENRKTKHKKEDGTYPSVKLLKAASRICDKSLGLSREIDVAYEDMARERVKRAQSASQRYAGSVGSPVAAYHAHLENIRQHLTIEDVSRVDAMIAVRMRATGHSQQAVAEAIEECAPALRGEFEQRRDWNRYAQRTAEYAFGLAGDRDLKRNEKYMEFWGKLEGSEQPKQRSRMRMG